jgi:hypothetical protein
VMFHSPPCSAKFKNKWSYTSAPPIRVHAVDRTLPSFFPFHGFCDSKLILKGKIHRVLVERFCLFIRGLFNNTVNGSDILRRMSG